MLFSEAEVHIITLIAFLSYVNKWSYCAKEKNCFTVATLKLKYIDGILQNNYNYTY